MRHESISTELRKQYERMADLLDSIPDDIAPNEPDLVTLLEFHSYIEQHFLDWKLDRSQHVEKIRGEKMELARSLAKSKIRNAKRVCLSR